MAPIPLNQRQAEAVRYIRNAIVHKGAMPTLRELMSALGYKSPRSAALIIQELIQLGVLKKRISGDIQFTEKPSEESNHARTVMVPLVGTVPCGLPLLAIENIETYFPVSVSLAKPGSQYFLLRATGDSMNHAGIDDGDLILVRQQSSANDGDTVVALIDDEATVKVFRRAADAVVLQPKSDNPRHQPIILTRNFQVQGVAVATVPNFNS